MNKQILKKKLKKRPKILEDSEYKSNIMTEKIHKVITC